MAMQLRLVCPLVFAALAALSAQAQPEQTTTITGTVLDAGVPCLALRGADGVVYTLRRTQAVRGLQPGERIRVTGRIAKASICQQGVTIETTGIEKLR